MSATASAPPLPRIEVSFTTRTSCLLLPAKPPAVAPSPATSEASARAHAPRLPSARRPPLLLALHGQGQSGERHWHWLRDALPPHFAAAFPDGFHTHEVRKPGAPIRLGHAWYMYTGDQPAFARSLAHSEAALWELAEAASAALGTDPARLYLCGFSQGAYLAHCAAVRAPARVAGWVAQSGRLKTEFLGAELPGVIGKPVLIQHGRRDESLPVSAADDSAATLRAHGADVTLRLYDATHMITPEMVTDLRTWLLEREPAP